MKRRKRIVDLLRKHPELGGKWRYDQPRREWIRDSDGARVYSRSLCTIGENGGEWYHSRWYVEYPVHGPVREPRSIGECYASMNGALPGYVDGLYGIRERDIL